MKIEIPQIFWHGNRDRIMSLDFYPNTNYLVTCGAESEDKMWIKLWEIEELDSCNNNLNKNVNINQQNIISNSNLNLNQSINNIQNNSIPSINLMNNENSINNPFRSERPNPLMNIFNQNNDLYKNPACIDSNQIIRNDQEDFGINKDNTNLIPHNNISNPLAVPLYNYIRPKFLYDLNGAHTSTVNIIRFSPNGLYLASGGDDSAIVIWVQKSRFIEFGSHLQKIVWSNYKILRGHLSDIYDIAWSPDSKYIISGSVDNRALIWSLEKGKVIDRSIDHTHFVQGVSWDPKNKFITTQSSDKSAKILCNANIKNEIKFYPNFVIKKYSRSNYDQIMYNLANATNENFINEDNKMEVDDEGNIKLNSNSNSNLSINNPNGKSQERNKNNGNKKDRNSFNNNIHYFSDEIQCNSFVRRHGWSPDGSILLLVAGLQKDETGNIEHVVWVFSREDLSKPSFYLPTLDKSPVCVRFCPIIFKKDENINSGEPEMIDLPYKMVFAVGTIDSLYIYDTQSIVPRYAITNIHYQALTDLAWKRSSMLAASSADGYISFFLFDKNELGIPEDPVNLSEELKIYAENYLNIDMNKNIYQTTNVTTVVKARKKKEDEKNLSSSITNNNESKKLNNEISGNNNFSHDEGENHLTIQEHTDKIDTFNLRFGNENNLQLSIEKENKEIKNTNQNSQEEKMNIDDFQSNFSNVKSNLTQPDQPDQPDQTDQNGIKKKKRITPEFLK